MALLIKVWVVIKYISIVGVEPSLRFEYLVTLVLINIVGTGACGVIVGGGETKERTATIVVSAFIRTCNM